MTAAEKRSAVIKKYEEILGRNKYSQPKRDYCYKKYSDGKYYSDCSSSVSYAYKEAGYSFGILNTVGMYQSKKMTDVPVVIKNGVIQNPEILRPGDMLLFAGTDSSRAYAGYVGHVEMVAKINGSTITIYGHGSGTPRATEMNAYCKSRYAKKTSTKLGNRGLIRVRRFIQDDVAPEPTPEKPESKSGYIVRITGGSVRVRTGPGTQYTAIEIVHKGDEYPLPDAAGWCPIEFGGHVYWVSEKYSDIIQDDVAPESKSGYIVRITGGSVRVRTGPGTQYTAIEIVHKGDEYPLPDAAGWCPIEFGGHVYWVSEKYSDIVKEG